MGKVEICCRFLIYNNIRFFPLKEFEKNLRWSIKDPLY